MSRYLQRLVRPGAGRVAQAPPQGPALQEVESVVESVAGPSTPVRSPSLHRDPLYRPALAAVPFAPAAPEGAVPGTQARPLLRPGAYGAASAGLPGQLLPLPGQPALAPPVHEALEAPHRAGPPSRVPHSTSPAVDAPKAAPGSLIAGTPPVDALPRPDDTLFAPALSPGHPPAPARTAAAEAPRGAPPASFGRDPATANAPSPSPVSVHIGTVELRVHAPAPTPAAAPVPATPPRARTPQPAPEAMPFHPARHHLRWN